MRLGRARAMAPLASATLAVACALGVLTFDAPPLPTSKEQCKRSGWRGFGFPSQGRCVAFVQRGPQP